MTHHYSWKNANEWLEMSKAGVGALRQSSRLEATESIRILDEASRTRRLRKQLASLEQDNSHDDPHAHLQWAKNMPKFEDHEVIATAGGPNKVGRKRVSDADDAVAAAAIAKKKRRFRSEHFKQRFRKTFAVLLEEEHAAKATPNEKGEKPISAYELARAPPSRLPARKFCGVCGFPSKYTCVRCGSRFCCMRCRDVHSETRCMKWTV